MKWGINVSQSSRIFRHQEKRAAKIGIIFQLDVTLL